MNNVWNKQQNDPIQKNVNNKLQHTPISNKSNYKDKLYTAKELIYWSSKNNGNEIIFDKLLDIHDDIKHFLNVHELKIKTDKELFLMKLLLFVYDNSND